MESDGKRSSEENHFRRLYDKVISEFLEQTDDVTEEEIMVAISCIKDSFNRSKGRRFTDLDFNSEDILCGYIDRYGPHGAGLARCKVLEALKNCTELVSLLSKSRLKVVSLGGGPGNDAIGFCSAMSQSDFAGRLVIHVVDEAKLWQNCISKVRELLDKGNYGDASHLFQQEKVELYFSPFTLPEDLRYLPMHEFDVVLICKLISIMEWSGKRNLVQKLYSTIKDSALILLIDSPFWDDLWAEKFDVLYLSRKGDDYRSGTRNIRRFEHDDFISSKARIAVLRKRTLPVRNSYEDTAETSASPNIAGPSSSTDQDDSTIRGQNFRCKKRKHTETEQDKNEMDALNIQRSMCQQLEKLTNMVSQQQDILRRINTNVELLSDKLLVLALYVNEEFAQIL